MRRGMWCRPTTSGLRGVVIGSTIVNALEQLDLQFPKVDKSELSEFHKVREALVNERQRAVRAKKVAVKKAATGKTTAVSAQLPPQSAVDRREQNELRGLAMRAPSKKGGLGSSADHLFALRCWAIFV